MVITVDQTQEDLLISNTISPIALVDITSSQGTLRFCTSRSVTFEGNRYQPYLSTFGNVRSSATFPESNTANRSFSLQFNNGPITYSGVDYDSLSQMFYPVFPWELSEVSVRIMMTSGTSEEHLAGNPIPWVTSGTAGTPTSITRDTFILPVNLPDFILNDQLPHRIITIEDFPEADKNELDGRTAIPLVVGSGVKVRARATTAGATTTVRTAVSAGTVLEVTSTNGFNPNDEIIIGGMTIDSLTVSNVDAIENILNLSDNINTLPGEVTLGMVVREDKTQYDYAINNAESAGAAFNVTVTRKDSSEPLLIDPSKYSTLTVSDPNAIGGKRTDLRITELFPFGNPAGGVSTQPVHSVPGGNHAHAVGLTGAETTSIHFANSILPGGATNANDGNAATFYTNNNGAGNQAIFKTHPAIDGVFVSQRYIAIIENVVYPGGDVRLRRSTTNFLTLASLFAKGEFRSAIDTGGDEESDWNQINNESSGANNIYEGWKEVTMTPAVSESTINLASTDRDTDVEVSGANIEIGDIVEVSINGVPIPNDTGRYGPTTASGQPIERPDAIMRWIIEQALQKQGLIDETTYNESAQAYEDNGIKLRFAVDSAMKTNALLDQIANNSRSTHWWGREGHNIKYLPTSGTSVASFDDDVSGVMDISWQNNSSAYDIRNKMTAYFDKDWTRSGTKSDSYTSSVLGIDQKSIGVFGNLSNVISELDSSKAFHFDMVATASGAQGIMDEIVGHTGFPKKVFNIETSWQWMNLEPTDIITVNTDTLAEPVEARITEHEVDSRFTVRMKAVETSAAVPSHYTSLKLGVTQNYPGELLGIANNWTTIHRFKLSQALSASPDSFFMDWTNNVPGFTFENRIRLFWNGNDAGAPTFNVQLWDQNASDQKHYEWDNLLNDIVGKWQTLVVQWDGVDISLWMGEIGSLGNPITESRRNSDDAITQVDVNRRSLLSIASNAHLYHIGVWDTNLSQAELNFLDQNTFHDFREDEGAYTSSANNKHWWRFCLDPNDLGKDYAVTATGIDINNQGNSDADDCVRDFPV